MTMNKHITSLRFQGSVWCNLDIALRNMDQVFGQVVQPLGLTVIEWYILRALYEQDGQHASELARAVGRAATSFTPNLDKLQNKGLIERRADPADRRAVRIFLTKAAEDCRDAVQESAQKIDRQIAEMFSDKQYEAFQQALALLQTMSLD
jgi:DNA-binding MarR family transcriptional regulator